MFVKFLQDAEAITEKGSEILFQAGQESELSEASAERWIRRGIAVIAEKKAPRKKRTTKKAK